jgi:DNA-binding transcriptional LysR family regulator
MCQKATSCSLFEGKNALPVVSNIAGVPASAGRSTPAVEAIVPASLVHPRHLRALVVLFCRPSSWRNYLEQLSADRSVSLNVAFEADSLSLQTQIVSEGGIYALLGPYAIAKATKERPLRSSKLVAPVVTRNIALSMSRHASLTLARRTVMQLAREIAKSGAAGLRRKS